MLSVVWRVEALALPPLSRPCPRCARISSFACSERFRVNANGGRLDVWLLYRCSACGELHKERIVRRAHVAELASELRDAYQGDAPALVRSCAFARGGGAEVPYRVVRPPLREAGALTARIVQPDACGARWDRLLARELGWPRARVAREAGRGALRVNGGVELRRAVADGDSLEVAFAAGQSAR